MKKTKLQPVPPEAAKPSPIKLQALFDKFSKEILDTLPKTSELAQLAATLSHGIPIESLDPARSQVLAAKAMSLWLDCSQKRSDAYNRVIARGDFWAEKIKKMPLDTLLNLDLRPTDKKHYSFDQLLKAALPGKRSEDRMKIYREAVRDHIRQLRTLPPDWKTGNIHRTPLEEIPIPSDDEVAKEISAARANGFDDDQFKIEFFEIHRFFEKYEKENLTKRAQAGGRAKKCRIDTAKKKQK